MHGGGFARKAHFKKWYKKAFLAVLDCMLLNALIAWNLSCSEHRSNRRPLKRHEFYTWVAECMMNYRDPSILPRSPEQVRDASLGLCPGREVHRPVQAPKRSRCVVCRLDCNYERKGEQGVMENTCSCTQPNCERIGHNSFLLTPRKIHEVSAFVGMTCFEILHSAVGKEAWSHRGAERSLKEKNYSVSYSHPAVQELRVLHGLNAQQIRRRGANTFGQDDIDYQADTEESQSQNT